MDQALINVAEETVNQDTILVERINNYFTCCIFSVIVSLIIIGFSLYIYGITINVE
jgi:hypothetical protein